MQLVVVFTVFQCSKYSNYLLYICMLFVIYCIVIVLSIINNYYIARLNIFCPFYYLYFFCQPTFIFFTYVVIFFTLSNISIFKSVLMMRRVVFLLASSIPRSV